VPLTRRTLLAAAGAAPLVSLAKAGRSNSVRKPKMLRDGDTVAIIAPSSAIHKQEDLDKARHNVESLGFKAKPGAHALDYWGYLAGADENRAADVNSAFADPEVKGIICLQGGYGAARFLDLLDYDAIRRNPKVLVGYSDITALLLSLYARAGVVTFHGPIALSTFDEFDVQNLTKAIKSAAPIGQLSVPVMPTGSAPQPASTTLFPGKASGRLVGGNLSLVASLIGSPYLPRLDGHLLFLEDIGEDPYRIDRMLNSLRISGAIRGVRGLVFGDFSPRGDHPTTPTQPEDAARDFTMLQVMQNFANQIRVPAYCGAWFGHIREKNTLPLGIQANLDADTRTVDIVESAVSAT